MKFQTFLSLLSTLATISLTEARPNAKECWSKKFGIECCEQTEEVVRETYDGLWGKENGQWCGIKNLRPEDDIPPSPPALTDLDSINDPAADCDLTDVTTGESLAQAAPFRFGVGLNGGAIETSTTSSKGMREIIKHQFNSVTYSNLMKPLFILNQEKSIENLKQGKQDPGLDFSSIVDGLDFCQKNGIHMRGHVIIWHNQTPAWFFRENYEDDGNYVDAGTMEYRIESYTKQMFDFLNFNYPGVVDAYDIVNEAVEITGGEDYYDSSTGWYTRKYSGNGSNAYYDIFGPDYVFKSFRIARKYALPTTKLVYNDYSTFVTEPISKREAIVNLLGLLQKEDLVDAIGMQSYINPDQSIKEYLEAIDVFQKTGLEIQITELTIRTKSTDDWEDYQNEQYGQLFKGLMKDVRKGYNIGSVTVFGLQDGYRFYENDSQKTRLFDHDLQKKRVYHTIMDIINESNAIMNGELPEISDEEEEEEEVNNENVTEDNDNINFEY